MSNPIHKPKLPKAKAALVGAETRGDAIGIKQAWTTPAILLATGSGFRFALIHHHFRPEIRHLALTNRTGGFH
jgi:hypothetical protein